MNTWKSAEGSRGKQIFRIIWTTERDRELPSVPAYSSLGVQIYK